MKARRHILPYLMSRMRTRVENAISRIEKEIGAIDVLFNNAGIQRRHPFTEFPVQEWNDVISVNQTAVFLVSQAVAKRMITRSTGQNRQHLLHAK
jgi:gluconate 5-dehydrogenase